jgi:predicted HAD superfamily Cof-like phosphohydrolase
MQETQRKEDPMTTEHTKLHRQLLEFHAAFGHPISSTPCVPPDEQVRLRGRLIIEEAIEALEAMFDTTHPPDARVGPEAYRSVLEMHKVALLSLCAEAPVKVDLVKLADACGDEDYVVEGTRIAFGINGAPIADEIHRSNMAKLGGKKDAHGKTHKPAGWTPPDIAGELHRQGLLTAPAIVVSI